MAGKTYRSRRNNKARGPQSATALTAAGAALLVVGVPMLFFPGPGLVACACGAACLARGAQLRKKK